MSFSKKKFLSFNNSKQAKEFYKILTLIEKNWNIIQNRTKLIEEFNTYSDYLNESKTIFRIYKKIPQNIIREDFTKIIMKFNKKMNINEKDYEFIIEKYDGKNLSQNKKTSLIAILDNLRSAFNVGSIFRTAECIGLQKLLLSGYTPTPENKKVRDTSMSTYEFIDWESIESTKKRINLLKKSGYTIYSFETVNTATNIFDIKFEEKSCLIFGNEALGISEEILKESDEIVKIPVFGWKNSLNVGVSFSIGAYEYLKQFYKNKEEK